jgi:arsenate reductase-like glutaredoxin family protein
MKKIATVIVLLTFHYSIFGQNFPNTIFNNHKIEYQEIAVLATSLTTSNLQAILQKEGYNNYSSFESQNLAYNSNLDEKINIDYHEVVINGIQKNQESNLLKYILLILQSNGFESYGQIGKANEDRLLNTLISIDLGLGERGSVIVIDEKNDSFTVNTIKSPKDGSHPLSGARRFGWKYNGNNSYVFYTMALDGINNSFLDKKGNSVIGTFSAASNFWKEVFSKTQTKINQIGFTWGSSSYTNALVNPKDIYNWILNK